MTPSEINQRLLAMIESVVEHLLPNGKREGHNWAVGSVAGEPGSSMKVCISGSKQGVWSDFSTSTKGGDLIDLWQQVKGVTFKEALDEAKSYAGISDTQPDFYPAKKKKKPVVKPKCKIPDSTVNDWFSGRGISEDTVKAYMIGQQGNTIIFPFKSPSGELELIKYRNLDEESKTGKKKIWSNEDPDYHLFGWQSIKDNDKEVVITEGEIDCMSYYQQGYAALSIPQGAGDGEKQQAWIRNDFDRLERFRVIYISMDMDEPGQKAIQPIISALGQERCKIVNLGEFKDANEAHINGELLEKYLKVSQTKDPEELKMLSSYHSEIMEEFKNSENTGMKLPWAKTFKTFRARPSEITVWAGVNSHGKSIILSHVAVDGISQGEVFCIASMEMKPRKLGRKMYQQVAGHDYPSSKEGNHIMNFIDNRLLIFEAYGTTKASRILEVFDYARRRYGVTQFIVDSLAKCGFGEDDYNGQKCFVDQLMEFAGKNNVHVHLVVHVRKKEDESKVPGKMDIKGTGAISDMVSNVMIIWRNKPKEEAIAKKETVGIDTLDAVLNCVKQRETGEEPYIGLYFHKPSCQFLEHHESEIKQYIW